LNAFCSDLDQRLQRVGQGPQMLLLFRGELHRGVG
jgi:hypothetical protein